MTSHQLDSPTCCLDVKTFIEEVEHYPVIWDLKCQEYRYVTKKQDAWITIAKKFFPEFENLTEMEKRAIYKRLNDKWRNIRDSYVRDIKRPTKRGYMYGPSLRFLNNLYNITEFTDEDDQENKGNDEQPRKSFEATDTTWPSDNDDVSDNPKRPRIKKDVEMDSLPPYQVEDDDYSFFESLLPAVREFDLDQKLEFRSEMLMLVKNIRRNISTQIKTEPAGDEFE